MKYSQVKKIREQYLSGMKACDIAKENNISRSTVYYYTKDIDKKERKARIIKIVIEDYFSGKSSVKEICDKYNICSFTLYNYLKQYKTMKNISGGKTC